MTQAIKISDELKNKLQQLQAQFFLETCKKISLKDLLEGLLTAALTNSVILSQVLQKNTDQAAEDHWRQKFNHPVDWGITDSSADIDDHIAGQ